MPMRVYTYICTHVCVCFYMYTHKLYLYVNIKPDLHTCAYVRACVHSYVHTYKEGRYGSKQDVQNTAFAACCWASMCLS